MNDELDFEEMFKPYILNFNPASDDAYKANFETAVENQNDAFGLLADHFNEEYGTIDIDDNLIQISTGGWSDNQYLISCFKKTFWFKQNLFATIVGGHYFFNTDRHAEKEWDIIKK